MEENNKKKNLYFLIPIAAAIVVIIAFAVSGHITKNNDKENPTAKTEISVVNTTEESSTKEEDSKVTFVGVGDNLIHNTLISAGEQEDKSLDYTSLYANIKPYIENFDIAYIDQETILGGKAFEYSGYPMFNSPWEIGAAAIDAGFDIFGCATNHTMDMGYSGIEKEIEFFSEHKDVVQLGVNSSEEQYNNITYYEKNGITFALFNYTYGTNDIPLPKDKPWCVNMMDKEKITKDIKEARANADVVIVFPHWGDEYSFEVSDYQKEYVKLFSDLGVDLVVGCHPHVIEPVEWVTNQSTGKKMLVYYSTGNFISHQIDLENLVGGAAEVTFEKHNGKTEITYAKFVPLVCHYKRGSNNKFEFNVYKLADYNDDLAETHSQKGGTVEYYTNLVKNVISDEFLSLS
ncbi:MAG: CapA family protein [Acetobacter sp.]|nr:CapA family protein [Bacteroides sp.]MCM1341711.1 CapA family protein [Acetobacter sp.]MCM1432350.1 CapA family protein [Clostridiales bacterium]